MSRRLAVSLLAFLLVAVAPAARAADPAVLAAARAALQAGVDSARVPTLLGARARFQALADAEPDSVWLHYWVAVADWRLVPLMMGGDRARAERLCRDGITHCDAALGLDPKHAEALAVKASLEGMLTVFDPGAMMTLGPQSVADMARAAELAPANPRVWLLDGIITLNKPEVFGGGAGPALEKLRKAQAFFASAPADSAAPGWGADDAWTWGGRAAQRQNDLAGARAMFARALEINPRSLWVRNVLLPAVRDTAAKAAGR
ncbi:MAG TPA: hypothetical protein VMS88_03135 [Terriglobales bacterium]|nr:hypothetical protein [Terriglobales bacterium]